MTIYYKWTRENARPVYGSGEWSLPTRQPDGTWLPGDWMPEWQPVLCKSGYHMCEQKHMIAHMNAELWEIEPHPRAVIVYGDDKLVASVARLVRKVETWTPRVAAQWALDCAEHALGVWEARYPDDARPRKAIKAGRACLDGTGTPAADAACAAADAAAYAARAAADAADAAAYYAAAADAAERQWQLERLRELLREGCA